MSGIGVSNVSGEVEVKNDSGSEVPVTGTFAKRFAPGVRTTVASTISTTGDNTIVTPAAGMRLRVTWLGLSSSQDNAAEVLAIVKFAAAGAAKYRWYMGNPGAFSHWEAIEGGANEALIVNLSGAQAVQVNVTYEEF